MFNIEYWNRDFHEYLHESQADSNSTLPCTVNSVRILHAPNTRKDFLQHVVAPLLKANNDRTYTLSETLQLAHDAAQKLRKFSMQPRPERSVPNFQD